MRNCWNNVVLLVRSRWQMNLNKMCLNYNTTAMTWLVDLTPWHRKQVSSIESTVIWMLQYRLKICVQSMYMYKSKGQLNSEWSAITFLIWLILEARGSFTNYVDQFFTYFDHLPTYRGLSWTFGAPPTPCPRGHR